MIWSKIFRFHKPNPIHELRLAILWVLKGLPNDFGIHLGLKCASFSKMNVGTSRRAPCAALGFESFFSVLTGNQLFERMGLAIRDVLMLILPLICALLLIKKCGDQTFLSSSDCIIYIYIYWPSILYLKYYNQRNCNLPQELFTHLLGNMSWSGVEPGAAQRIAGRVLPSLQGDHAEHFHMWWSICSGGPKHFHMGVKHVQNTEILWSNQAEVHS